MPTIVTKRVLNPTVTLMEVDCPAIARKAKPGQFVMVRSDPMGERIPLTIADYDAVRGTVTIMYQRVGLTTQKLDQLNSGDDILDMVGPLGNPTEVDGVKRAVVIGGGVGCAIAFPQAKALYRAGAHVDVIVGFRTKELVFLEGSFRKNCTNLYITTDDGTYGEKGFVSNKLDELLSEGQPVRRGHRHRPGAHDAGHLPGHPALSSQDSGLPQPPDGGRHRHVRLLPGARGRPDQVCLRGRPGLRRPPSGL